MLWQQGTVLRCIPFEELQAWIDEPLPNDVCCLDIEGASRLRPSDNQVWMVIKDKTVMSNSSAFQQLDADKRNELLIELKDRGASLRQLEGGE